MRASWDNLVQPPKPGRVEVICGCMFAGKTARLIERLKTAEAGGLRALAFKHVLDNRYAAGRLVTHDGQTLEALTAATVADILENAAVADVVGIDEGQFFGEPLAAICRQLAAAGRTVIVAGIDNDAWGRPFPPFPRLKEIAVQIEVLHQPCGVCHKPAYYSQRMVPVVNGRMVGGPEAYQPRCGDCFQPLPMPAPAFA